MRIQVSLLLVLFLFASLSDCSHHESPVYQDRLAKIMLDAGDRDTGSEPLPRVLDRICYGELGCFSSHPFGEPPEQPETIQPTFQLYINNSNDTPALSFLYNSSVGTEDATIERALSDRSKLTIFIAHGFGGDGNLDWIETIRKLKIEQFRANVIVIDWALGARLGTMYTKAAANVPMIARMTAKFAENLINEYRIPIGNIQFVGFSLGAQMGGFFAKELSKNFDGQLIGKLTALDAASPLFEANGIFPRKEDVTFLEAVHTSAGNALWKGKLGVETNYGHADYYPNGGVEQPGCGYVNIACAHNRAIEYYIEALAGRERCRYQGFPCTSVKEAQSGECAKRKDPYHYLSMKRRARVAITHQNMILYLRTNDAAPFCLNEQEVSR